MRNLPWDHPQTTSPLGGSSKNWNLGRFSRLNWGERGREGGSETAKIEATSFMDGPHLPAIMISIAKLWFKAREFQSRLDQPEVKSDHWFAGHPKRTKKVIFTDWSVWKKGVLPESDIPRGIIANKTSTNTAPHWSQFSSFFIAITLLLLNENSKEKGSPLWRFF